MDFQFCLLFGVGVKHGLSHIDKNKSWIHKIRKKYICCYWYCPAMYVQHVRSIPAVISWVHIMIVEVSLHDPRTVMYTPT